MALVESYFTTAAGEFYVAHKLALLGLVPAFPRNSVRAVDLLVSDRSGSKAIGLLVCTVPSAVHDLRRSDAVDTFMLDFPLSHRAVVQAPDSAIFCLVDLMMRTRGSSPEAYIIPAGVLKRDFVGIHAKKYSYTRYKRSRQAMEYYRENWRPILDAVNSDARTTRASPPAIAIDRTMLRPAIPIPAVVNEREQIQLNVGSADTP